jgi:hypothetical protein
MHGPNLLEELALPHHDPLRERVLIESLVVVHCSVADVLFHVNVLGVVRRLGFGGNRADLA